MKWRPHNTGYNPHLVSLIREGELCVGGYGPWGVDQVKAVLDDGEEPYLEIDGNEYYTYPGIIIDPAIEIGVLLSSSESLGLLDEEVRKHFPVYCQDETNGVILISSPSC